MNLPGVGEDLILSFAAVFVALDVVGVLPIYLSVTQRLSGPQREKVVDVSVFVAFFVALVFMFAGEPVFRALSITLPDFRIAGGLILLLIAIADLMGKPESQNRVSGSTGIVPLAVPLITGPAVLTTVILQAARFGYGITSLALLLNFLLAWIVFRQSKRLERLIGRDGTMIISKIAALLLAAMSVATMRQGFVELGLITLKN